MICPNCEEEFDPSHGNQVYCCEECYEMHKRARQKEINAILKDFKDGYLSNYRLFQKLLPVSGRFNISLYKLLKQGFDQHAFYGIAIGQDKIHWHKVNEYLFSIVNLNNEPTLDLYKP